MTPLQVKAFIQSRKQVSESQIQQQFNMDKGLLDAILGFWQRRGNILLQGCGHCITKCGDKTLYTWVGDAKNICK